MLLLLLCIYLDLRKDTNSCPFARFLPLGRISCKGAGNGHFLTTVVNFEISYLLGWYYFTLRKKNIRCFWADIPGKGRKYPGKGPKYPGRFIMTQKWKHETVSFFLEMVIFILKWTNLQKMDRNQTKICPGKKFATNEYPGIYVYIYIPRPAGWVKISSASPGLRNYCRFRNVCRLSQKLPVQLFGGILAGSAAILSFFALFWYSHTLENIGRYNVKVQICVENNQNNLRRLVGNLCRFSFSIFGWKFSRWTHELCVLHAAKVSSTPMELTESHSTQNITICWSHPKSKNFRLIKKAPFEGWPLQKLIFHQT